MTAFKTTHDLDFEIAAWKPLIPIDNSEGWKLYRVGTCEGQWRATKDAYEILSIINTEMGNGHFEDVLEWFEYSCKRDGKSLRIRCVWNRRLKHHLIRKCDFVPEGAENVVKHFGESMISQWGNVR